MCGSVGLCVRVWECGGRGKCVSSRRPLNRPLRTEIMNYHFYRRVRVRTRV